MRARSSWRLFAVGVLLVALAVAIRLYSGPLKHWLISIHGGGAGAH